MPYQPWSRRHPPPVYSSHLMCSSPIHPPSLPPTVYLFIYSSIHPLTIRPSVHPPPFCLFTVHPLSIHPSTIQPLPSNHPLSSIYPPTIHLSINSSIRPPSSHPSPIHPPFHRPFIHLPSIHPPSMGPCTLAFSHSSAHRPFIYHSFFYSFSRSLRNLT